MAGKYRRKWTREEALEGLRYLYQIYNLAPARAGHYLCLVLLEQLLNPSRRLPLPETIYKYWPNVRDAWRAAGLAPVYSVDTLKLDFPFSSQVDAAIAEVYADYQTRRDRFTMLSRLTEQHRIPVPALALRAGQLKLDGNLKIDWTDQELELLKSSIHLSKQQIRRRLIEAGYQRSFQSARIIKAKKAFLDSDCPSHYSREQLSYLIGFDSKHIGHWISQGLLTYEMKGTVRTRQQGGDTYLIKADNVAALFREHPELLDLRKVDQAWLINLLRETDPLMSSK